MTVMDMAEEMIITQGCKLLLDAFHFVGISSCKSIPNNRDIFRI
jgi:hypothetical protein